ncbi:class I SAM-dependent methyltransferase [Patulibacter defluvii]|uniref:class I SAM-dependent methyltransferase n=1 Tax=Patulibacter defluvii TaxID=3095358 RepID=UPI002A74CB26|nr:class I SAM-dependent methyltransferase [Patulibacter sp. DM4]
MPGPLVTGERVSSPEGAFNPTFQRHVAAYRQIAERLPAEGPVLDLGCGVGHSFRELAPRTTIGVDVSAEALRGQERETHVHDMRQLPADWSGRFASLVSVHSIEHVTRPGQALAEIARVLQDDGVAVLVTPNRLTFARADEIVDPYHEIEYDTETLRALVEPWFAEVEILGLHGSPRYLEFQDGEKARMERLLNLDRFGFRHRMPRWALRLAYDSALTITRRGGDERAAAITAEDFFLTADDPAASLDLVAVARRPRR